MCYHTNINLIGGLEMKKTVIKIASVMIALLMMACVFASCAKKLSGSYQAGLSLLGQGADVTYTFSGSKVEATQKLTILGSVKSNTVSGTYEITENADGSMEITFDFEEESDIFKDGTYTFSEGEGYVKIAGVTYSELERE